MSKKEIVEKGFSLFKTFDLNMAEIELILEEIEKNSQIITDDVLIDTADKTEVFFPEQNKLVIKGDFLKKIEDENNVNEFDILFTILSLKANDGNLYQFVSVDRYQNLYLNFKILKKIVFNEYYYMHLHNLKYNEFNLSNVLNIIFRGLIIYAEPYFKAQYNNVFEEYPIFKKIEILKTLFEMTNSKFGELDDRVYVYYLNKYKTYENLKKDLNILKENGPSSKENVNVLLLKEMLSVKHNVPFKIRTAIPDIPEDINMNTGFSYYQSIVFNNFKYSNEYVLGLAGSGKTHMASIIAKIFLIFKAVWFANKREGLAIQYTSYSKESVQKSFVAKIPELAVYFEKNGDLTISAFNQILENIDNSYFSEEDMEKLKKLDVIFRNKKDILTVIEKMYEKDKYYTELFNKLIKKEEGKTLLKIIKQLSKTKEGFSILIKLKIFIAKLIRKNETGMYLEFSNKVLKKIERIIGDDVKELKKIDYMEIDSLLEKYKKIYNEKMKEHYKTVKELAEDEKEEEKIEINADELDFDSILFYIKNMWRLLSDEDISKIKNSIQKMIYKNDEFLTVEDFNNYHKIIPIMAMSIDEVFNIPIDFKIFLNLIDEVLLINNFLYYSIFARNLITYSFGDINQMNLDFLYNRSILFEKIKHLYEGEGIFENSEILQKNLFLNENYNVSSIWDIISKESYNINLLIDNFRNIKYLVYTLVKANSTYISYIKKFVSSNKNILNKSIVEKVENAKDIDDIIQIINIFNNELVKFKNFDGYETDIPLIVFDNKSFKNRAEMFDRFFNFIKIQDFSIKNILFVSVFKQDVPGIKNDIDFVLSSQKEPLDIHIDVFPANKIQALEYDLVVLLLEDGNSRKYLVENDKLLNVIISRARKGFIVICNVEECKNDVVSNIFIERKFQIIKT
jgi:hypothetical protein